MPPVDPPPSEWVLPEDIGGDEHGLVGIGADLEPGTLLTAYRSGLFPMPVHTDHGDLLGWFSPDPRGILPLDGLRVSRSLRAACRRYEIRIDSAFAEVLEACADPARPGGWISPAVASAYVRLHELGWAHSVEAWADGQLAGGLYGVAVDGLFAGESMFHHRTDASKAALVALVDLLRSDGESGRLLDVQWPTDHLRTLGVVEVPRKDYLELLSVARSLPLPSHWR